MQTFQRFRVSIRSNAEHSVKVEIILLWITVSFKPLFECKLECLIEISDKPNDERWDTLWLKICETWNQGLSEFKSFVWRYRRKTIKIQCF